MIVNDVSKFINVFKERGWHLSKTALQDLVDEIAVQEDGSEISLNVNEVTKLVSDTDLHSIGEPILKDIDSFCNFKDPLVLQIDKIRNIAKPKASEDKSKDGDRFLRLVLSDGHTNIVALEMKRISNLSIRTPPGTKIQILLSKVEIERNFWLLDDKNCKIFGGEVKYLIEKWKADEDTKFKPRMITAGSGGGPPPWVSFGAKVDTSQMIKGFIAMSVNQSSESAPPVSKEFEESRKAVIAQFQSEAGHKSFGSAPVLVKPTKQNNENPQKHSGRPKKDQSAQQSDENFKTLDEYKAELAAAAASQKQKEKQQQQQSQYSEQQQQQQSRSSYHQQQHQNKNNSNFQNSNNNNNNDYHFVDQQQNRGQSSRNRTNNQLNEYFVRGQQQPTNYNNNDNYANEDYYYEDYFENQPQPQQNQRGYYRPQTFRNNNDDSGSSTSNTTNVFYRGGGGGGQSPQFNRGGPRGGRGGSGFFRGRGRGRGGRRGI